MKNKTAFLPIRVSVFNCGFPNEQIRFGKAIYPYLLPVPIGSLLFVLLGQYTRRFCSRGDGMPPCCLATGRWGAARRRLDTLAGLARDPAPCPPPGLMKNRQVDLTKIKSLLQKRQTSLCPGHEWLAIVVLWFHWNEFVLATATSTFEQRNSARNGSDRASDWSYQESTSCHMWKKKSFLFLELLFWKISH